MNQRLIDRFPLSAGSHPTREDGLCAMELVAWLAGEEHSDQPRCTCPVLAQAVRPLNDFLPDPLRTDLLRPLLPRLVFTRTNPAIEQSRGLLALDHVLRASAPRQLARKGQTAAASVLLQLPPIHDLDMVQWVATNIRRAEVTLPAEARWMLALAGRGAEPRSYVAGLAHAARALRDKQAFVDAIATVGRMTALGCTSTQDQKVNSTRNNATSSSLFAPSPPGCL